MTAVTPGRRKTRTANSPRRGISKAMRRSLYHGSKIIGILVASLLIPKLVGASCGLNWLVPSNHFNGVNEHGAVSHWEDIGSVDMGDGLSLPLIINFRSDRNSMSPFLGSGWILALLESHIYQLNERNFVMVQPDGPNRYFYRINRQDTVLKDRGGWAAELKGDTITAWAECGWKLTFKNGRLASMQTPENRRLDFVQDGGRTVELREGGQTHLKVVTNPSTGSVTGLEFNNRHIGIELENRPLIQNIHGQNVVGSMAPSLYRLTGTSTGPREYQFAFDDKFQPTLEISKPAERLFTWNPATRQIVGDTGWAYTITPGKDVFANAAIERKDVQGGAEFWHYDRAQGIETEQTADGVKKVTTYFTSGLLAGKLRRVEETSGGKTSVLRDLSYNEKGQPIRETGADGTVIAFKYDERSRLTDILRDGQPFARHAYDDKNRVIEEETFGVEKVTFRYLPTGGYEKSVLQANGEKETLVYDKAEKLIEGVFNGGEKVVFDGEFIPTIIPGNTEKRDALVKELAGQLQTLQDPIARGELLIRLGAIQTDEGLGPADPHTAIKIFQTILDDPMMDDYTKSQAYFWIASMYNFIGRSEWPKAVKAMEKILELRGEGLSAKRSEKFQLARVAAFRKMLAHMRTGEPKRDEEAWLGALKKYGSLNVFREQMDMLIAEQKRRLSSRYLNK